MADKLIKGNEFIQYLIKRFNFTQEEAEEEDKRINKIKEVSKIVY